MRLLQLDDNGEFSLAEHIGTNVPPYAILSHTWAADDEEVTFKDLIKGTGKAKAGYRKLIFCGKQAAKDNLKYFWVDTCCIDKSSSTELSEAINSMFQWYKEANKCYVYLPDVSTNGFISKDRSFQDSRWFTRGWTLQELLAPTRVDFFSVEGILLGDKTALAHEIAEITGISVEALRGKDMSKFSVDERFKWSKGRETKREEDFAYALFGIFGVHMPLIYGEGKEKALERLKKKLKKPAEKPLTVCSTLNLLCFLSFFVVIVAIYFPISHEPVPPQPSSPGHVSSHGDDMWRNGAAGHTAKPWLVPFMRPASFAGRETQLSQLDAHILSNSGRRLAIYGLGGCGKTALALELAYRTREQQPARAVFWVPAITRESFEQAYYEIGALLDISVTPGDRVDMKDIVKARLSDESFGSWLMVIDNADDISILLDRSTENNSTVRLFDYIPRSHHGSIIFTTRSREAAIALAESAIALGQFQKSEAIELLRNRLLQEHQHELENQETVEQFLETLTFLALAIIQAVAFINTNDISLSEYILYYRNNEKHAMELLSKEYHDQGRYPDSKNPMATTWYITFVYIQKHNVLAAEYLSLMTCISNSEIPGSILPLNDSVVEQVEAIGMLKAYAFITERQPQTHGMLDQMQNRVKIYDVHPLVHVAMRGWMKEQNQWSLWVERTLERLEEIIPLGGNYDPKIWAAYLPHAVYVTNIPESYNTQGRLLLLSRIGKYKGILGDFEAAALAYRELLKEQEHLLEKNHPDMLSGMRSLASMILFQGKYEAAEQIIRQALEGGEKALGKKHPDTLTSVSDLARVLYNQGKYKAAEEMIQRVLEGREEALGKEHPDTLTSVSDLAIILRAQGKYKATEEMSLRVLESTEKVLGKAQQDTLTSASGLTLVQPPGECESTEVMYRRALGWTEKILGRENCEKTISVITLMSQLQNQGKYEAAEAMAQRMLEFSEKMLGKEHPATLIVMHNLAGILLSQRKYKEAEAMSWQVSEGREEALGKEHPDTLTSMNNLVLVLQSQGKYKAAEEIIWRVLEGREKVLGKEHPETLVSVSNLASILWYQRKYEAAEVMSRRVLEWCEKVLGKEHSNTLMSVSNLAKLLQSQGKYEAAEMMSRRALEETEKVLGEEHPDTLTSLNNLASVLWHQENYDAAEAASRRVLEGREKVLGNEHPDTLMSVLNLGVQLQNQGKYKAAEAMAQRMLESSEKMLGKEHPATLAGVSFLASMLYGQGNYEAAKAMTQQVLEGRAKVLGKEHPDTLTSMDILGTILRSQRRYKAAKAITQQALEGREKVLGKEHPDTLTSMSNLAMVLLYQRKYKAAEEMNRRALKGREKVLGKEHPDTLTGASNLGAVLWYQRKYDAAEEITMQALEGREKVLGKEHSDTLMSVSNLAELLQSKGKYEAAEVMSRRALEGTEKVLGEEHPDTLISICGLACLLSRAHKYGEALLLYQKASSGLLKTLGPHHSTTRACQSHQSSLERFLDGQATDDTRRELDTKCDE